MLALAYSASLSWHAPPLARPSSRAAVTRMAVSSPLLPDAAQAATAPTEAAGTQERLAATAYFQPLQKGDILESTPQHRAICASALLLGGVILGKICWLLAGGCTWRTALGMAAAAFVGYEFADFGSGVYHWSMDNYGNKDTPIWGKQVRARRAQQAAPPDCARRSSRAPHTAQYARRRSRPSKGTTRGHGRSRIARRPTICTCLRRLRCPCSPPSRSCRTSMRSSSG